MAKRALLLGGTGAIGHYLAPELVRRGFAVDVTSRSEHRSGGGIEYIIGNAYDDSFLKDVLTSKRYDVVVDFMVYTTEGFNSRVRTLLDATTHYIFLSSYRVFADSDVIVEDSSRLLDSLDDGEYLKTDEYALAKARQEDILRATGAANWTIVRPAITYSFNRFQFGILEADTVLWRALRHKKIIMPREMLEKATTMTWAGDVAQLIASLVLNKKAYGQDFNLATSEHHTWAEVFEIYKGVLGLRLMTVPMDEYIAATQREYQVMYDRMYDRVLDNRKILDVVGPHIFTRLDEGLGRELRGFVERPTFTAIDYALQARIDRLTREVINPASLTRQQLKEYMKHRFPKSVKYAKTPKRALHMLRSKSRIRTRAREVVEKTAENIDIRWQAYLESRDLRKVNKIKSRPYGAIVTLIDYSNYGNIIQRFALQEFLYKQGYPFVSYEHALPINSKLADSKHSNISEFVNRYIANRPFSARDRLSAYVVGSDQVWRNWKYEDASKQLGFFFLDFVKGKDPKRIAYAASFGKDSLDGALITKQLSDHIKPLIDKFSAISVREKSGAAIVKQEWHHDADETIDPTMLLDVSDYDKIIDRSSDRDTATLPIFVYVLGPTEENRQLIERASEAMGVQADIINPYHLDALPSVAMWLKSIRDAELVITDSFHSTVFSIINNTPFIVVENEFGGIGRVETLLDTLGIDRDRIIRRHSEHEYSPGSSKPIDWDEVNSRLSALRMTSATWLLNVLNATN